MSYNVYITRLTNVRPHPNADRLLLAECFGNTVCVSIDHKTGDLGVYFPTDGQISEEFGKANDLFRRKDAEGNEAGGFIDANKRNIRCIRLRGEKSDGLYLPLSCLEHFGDVSELNEGDIVTVFNGHEIARKYIPRSNHKSNGSGAHNKAKKKKVNIAPLFQEHKDTEQLAYNIGDFKDGDQIEITLKMHGTSGRTAYLPRLKGYKRTWKDKLLRREGTPIYEWGYVTGTRRVVLERYDAGFYGSDAFRKIHAEKFEGKLRKGETVYYEIVGFTDTGVPIMPSANNKKLNDKEFIKKYGKETVFSYGCDPDGYRDSKEILKKDIENWEKNNAKMLRKLQSDIYVYRMTMTNEDGDVVEYTPDFMRYRCEQMGVKTVPVFWKGYLTSNNYAYVCLDEDDYPVGTVADYVQHLAESFYEGTDPIGKTHIREGVVVRIVNRPTFTAYKHKNFEFKVLENIIKIDAEAPDMEEIQEVKDDN